MEKEKVLYDELAISTGLRRGYVRIDHRGLQKPVDIEKALAMHKKSNDYKIVRELLDWGADRIYREEHQDSMSNQYMYHTYVGVKEV